MQTPFKPAPIPYFFVMCGRRKNIPPLIIVFFLNSAIIA